MNNNRLIFDLIHSKKLHFNKLYENGAKLNPTELFNLSKELISKIESTKNTYKSNFDIMATSKLSGEPDTCSDLDVRKKNVLSLFQSTLLYADQIWIKNPLDKYINIEEDYFTEVSNHQSLLDDIFILLHYEDLIQAGIVNICKTENHFCRHCLLNSLSNIPDSYKQTVDNLELHLMKAFKKDATYLVTQKDGNQFVKIEAKDNKLFPITPLYINYDELPKEFKNAAKRKSRKIYQREIEDSNLICSFINPIMDDIVMHDYYSNTFNLNYFTDRTIDSELIELLNGEEITNRSTKYLNSLQHSLPTISNVSVDKLVELRTEEPESFQLYRNSIDRVIRQSKNLPESQLKELIFDEVQESLDKINVVIRNSKSKLQKGMIGSVGVGIGLISIGINAGLFPLGLGAALMTYANSGHGAKAIQDLSGYLNKDDNLRNERYYFLWKVMN